jgi:glycosyltransferase involved in cell wall biosynthesis
MPTATPASDRGHVLIVVENMSVPADRRVWMEARALVSLGYGVSVVCPRGRERDTAELERLDGVSIHRFSLREAGGGAWSYLGEYGPALGSIRRLANRIDAERRVDAVHLCNPPDVLHLATRRLRKRGARSVFDHHDLVPELFEARFGRRGGLLHRAAAWFERRAFGAADVVLSPNESYRRIAIARGGKDPDDVVVVRIAPDLERFREAEPDPELRRGKEHLIAYAGTIGPQDGVDHALRALAALQARRDDWHATVAGAGDWRDDAIRLADELGLAGAVDFPGLLNDDGLVALLSTADVCLSPEPRNPLNDVSTMIKVVEYMALSRPVVAYDLTETRFSAGEAALYARPNDPEELASCIERLLDDPELRRRLGAEGRRRVEDELSAARSVEALDLAYRRVLRR